MKVKYFRQRDQQGQGAGGRKVLNVFKKWKEVQGGWDIVCVCVCVCVCVFVCETGSRGMVNEVTEVDKSQIR